MVDKTCKWRDCQEELALLIEMDVDVTGLEMRAVPIKDIDYGRSIKNNPRLASGADGLDNKPDRERYGRAMLAGDAMPALILMHGEPGAKGGKYETLSGCTRLGACLDNGYSSVMAYVVPWMGNKAAYAARALLNTLHGSRPDEQTMIAIATEVVLSGVKTIRDASKLYNVNDATLGEAVRVAGIRAEAASSLGINLSRIPATTVAALNPLMRFDKESFKKVATAVSKNPGGLNGDSVRARIKEAMTAPTSEAKSVAIESLVKDLAPKLGQKSSPTAKSKQERLVETLSDLRNRLARMGLVPSDYGAAHLARIKELWEEADRLMAPLMKAARKAAS